jgi:hypothetical protein
MRLYADEEGPDCPRTRDDVKTLTMLALAAHSRSIKAKDATQARNSTNTPAYSEDAE